jgi:hypothetical protein
MYAQRSNGTLLKYQSHNEARMTKHKVFTVNREFPNVAETMRRAGSIGTVELTLGSWQGSTLWTHWLHNYFIGEGAFGAVFSVTNTGEAARGIKDIMQKASYVVNEKPPPAGRLVLIKLALEPGQSTEGMTPDIFAKDSVKESSWHRFLDNAPCIRVRGVGASTCPSSVVPDFYWSGMVRDDRTRTRCYVTLMSFAPGATVSRHIDGEYKRNKNYRRFQTKQPRGPLTASMYLAIERAVTLMWLNGVVHSDFHKGNQIYDDNTGKVTVIDFGQAVGLHPELTQKLRDMVGVAILRGVNSLGEMWESSSKSAVGVGIQEYVDGVRYTRGGDWYNPDGHSLKMLYNRLSPADRQQIPLLRRKLWGVAVKPVPAPKPAPKLVSAVVATRLPTVPKRRGSLWGGAAAFGSPVAAPKGPSGGGNKGAFGSAVAVPKGPGAPLAARTVASAAAKRLSASSGRRSLEQARRSSRALGILSRLSRLSRGRAQSPGLAPMNIDTIGGKPVQQQQRKRGGPGSSRVEKKKSPVRLCRERGLKYDVRRRACVV